MRGDPVIEARGLSKRWGSTTALADLDVSIGSGVTGLLGSNGAGKTTLLGMVLGLHSPSAGSLRVLGHDPAAAGPEVRARIGYAPEHHELPPDVQAADLVRHVAELHGLPRAAATERANDALWQVGLGEERFRPIGTMSTGQRQRVKLAQAVAHDPALLLLDEPTDGLDPVQRDDMLHLIRRIGTEFGIDIVLSSHLLGEVERICDSVVIIEGGRVVRSGAISELRRGGDRLVVEVTRDTAELAALLRERGLLVTDLGARLVVETGGRDDASDVVRDAVVDLDLGLLRLQPQSRSLEDVFLEAR